MNTIQMLLGMLSVIVLTACSAMAQPRYIQNDNQCALPHNPHNVVIHVPPDTTKAPELTKGSRGRDNEWTVEPGCSPRFTVAPATSDVRIVYQVETPFRRKIDQQPVWMFKPGDSAGLEARPLVDLKKCKDYTGCKYSVIDISEHTRPPLDPYTRVGGGG